MVRCLIAVLVLAAGLLSLSTTLADKPQEMLVVRAFFDEVCADTPALRQRLNEHRLLKHANLDLNTTLAKHFPDYAP